MSDHPPPSRDTPGPQRTLMKGQQTRAAILEAALGLAANMGLQGLSIGALAERWGALRYLAHTEPDNEAIASWVPDTPVSDEPDAWHPMDALFAPMYSVSGRCARR